LIDGIFIYNCMIPLNSLYFMLSVVFLAVILDCLRNPEIAGTFGNQIQFDM
jgi:hypothetical protein